MAAAVVLLLVSRPGWTLVALVALVTTSWILTVKSWLGTDGADQMGQIVTIGALLMAGGRITGSGWIWFAGVLLIGGQLCLAYLSAGAAKLFSPMWRSGHALIGIMGTHSYGHPLGARLATRSRRVSQLMCWLIILAETAFPIAIFSPHRVLMVALVVMLTLHILNGYLMGLNLFIWAFLASYPSVIALNHAIRP